MFKNYKLHATLILLFADNFRIQQTKQQNLRVIEHLWALLLARHPRIQLIKQQNLACCYTHFELCFLQGIFAFS